jgi:Fic family protein
MTDDNAGQEPPPETGYESARVTLELTQSQIDRVIRDATKAGNANVSALLSGLTGIQETLARDPKLLDDPRTSTSLMRGLLVFAALPSDGSYIRISDIAEMLGTSPSTTHRYLTTLLNVGLAEQHPSSRRYRQAK